MTFILLTYVPKALDDFFIWLDSFWPKFVYKSLKASAILGLLETSTLLIVYREKFIFWFSNYIFHNISCF